MRARGVRSANLSIFNGPLDEGTDEAFRLHVRVIARRVPGALYVNDRGFMEMIHAEPVVESLPEVIASALKRGTVFN